MAKKPSLYCICYLTVAVAFTGMWCTCRRLTVYLSHRIVYSRQWML